MTLSDLFRRREEPRPQAAVSGTKARAGSLVAIVGVSAAAFLMAEVPLEESGRKVQVTIAPDGTPTVKHVAGKQYLKAYLDIASVPTACDGITRGVKMGQTYTEAQCAQMLERELVIHAKGVMACSPGLVGSGKEYFRIAAVGFAYNVGVAAYCGSSVAKSFNAGNYAAGCNNLLKWNKARTPSGFRVVKGLDARRKRERLTCLKGL